MFNDTDYGDELTLAVTSPTLTSFWMSFDTEKWVFWGTPNTADENVTTTITLQATDK